MHQTISWLINAEPWVAYRTLIDLCHLSEDDPLVQTTRLAMLDDAKIKALITELQDWPGTILKAHNNASHLLHKLVFLADLGIKATDPGIQLVVEKILATQSTEGMFQVLVNIKPSYGGSGEDQFAWMLCDAPLITYALLRFGGREDARLQKSISALIGSIHDNGWHCTVSPQLGNFRGPGRKSDPCPYATLVMLRVLSQLTGTNLDPARIGSEALLTLWQQRKERKAYLFGMGSNFSKLKSPLIWYDLLHVLDVLTNFTWLNQDERFQEMLDLLQDKADIQGRFTPDSVWMAWKGWEFGQKKQPSAWVTFIALRALMRAGRLSQFPSISPGRG